MNHAEITNYSSSTTLVSGAVSAELKSPACYEIGLRASKKGDYDVARQMLRHALDQLNNQDHDQAKQIRIITDISDTYLSEGNYALAESWYLKAFHRSELVYGANSLESASLVSRLAQVQVLNSNMSEYKKYFDKISCIYLLTKDENISSLLIPLMDLSWALCIAGQLAEVQEVNEMIAQIRELEAEDKISTSLAWIDQ